MKLLRLSAVLFVGSAFLPAVATAGGFKIFEQAGKAVGMAGAFVAQADDPSAIFYNPGAVSLLEEKPQITAGASLVSTNDSIFQGLSGIGLGFNGEQETVMTPLPHVFWVKQVTERLKVGAGLFSPYLLQVDWANKDSFPGRAISTTTDLVAYDLNPVASFRVIEGLGIGVGVVYRTANFKHQRRLQVTNPLPPGEVGDFANRGIETLNEAALGWNAAIAYRFLGRYSVGLAYRSAIEIDFSGTGKLEQIPTGNQALDDVLAATNPFAQDLAFATTMEFPDELNFGFAVQATDSITMELDVNQVGWSSLDTLVFSFPNNPLLTEVIPLLYEDTTDLRLGGRLRLRSGAELRFGVSAEESPVPDSTLGPFFPDADRTVVSAGFGKDWLDLAFMWASYDNRASRNANEFNGNYGSSAWLFAMTISQ